MGRVRLGLLIPWLIASVVAVGLLTFAHTQDEVPLSAPLLMAVAFLLRPLDYVWPRLRLLTSALFRGLFFGVGVEAWDAVNGDGTFDPVVAVGLGAVLGLFVGAWDYFHPSERDPDVSRA